MTQPLATLIATTFKVPLASVMLLRHSNKQVKHLRDCRASIAEHTAIQPKGSKWDFHRDSGDAKIRYVAVVVGNPDTGIDELNDIFEVGDDAEFIESYLKLESAPSRVSVNYTAFSHRPDGGTANENGVSRIFKLTPVTNRMTLKSRVISGWEGKARAPVSRVGSNFFMKIWLQQP